MSTKFSELKAMIVRSLDDTLDETGDALGGGEYAFGVLRDSVRAALNAITSRYWKRAVLEVEPSVESAAIPGELIDIDGVYDATKGIFLPKISFLIGNTLTASEGNGWFLYPTGYISFINTIGASGARVYYQSHWTVPESDGELLDIPDLALSCLIYYAGSYLLGSSAVSSASIRQFNTRVDSGQPGDIPQMKMSSFLMAKYEEELKRIPLMEKGRVI